MARSKSNIQWDGLHNLSKCYITAKTKVKSNSCSVCFNSVIVSITFVYFKQMINISDRTISGLGSSIHLNGKTAKLKVGKTNS